MVPMVPPCTVSVTMTGSPTLTSCGSICWVNVAAAGQGVVMKAKRMARTSATPANCSGGFILPILSRGRRRGVVVAVEQARGDVVLVVLERVEQVFRVLPRFDVGILLVLRAGPRIGAQLAVLVFIRGTRFLIPIVS